MATTEDGRVSITLASIKNETIQKCRKKHCSFVCNTALLKSMKYICLKDVISASHSRLRKKTFMKKSICESSINVTAQNTLQNGSISCQYITMYGHDSAESLIHLVRKQNIPEN